MDANATAPEFRIGPPATLADRLRHVLYGDDAASAALDGAQELMPREYLFEHEPDSYAGASEWADSILTWGTIYGIAYGLARAESPFEAPESVGRRAVDAATAFWEHYTRGERHIPPWATTSTPTGSMET